MRCRHCDGTGLICGLCGEAEIDCLCDDEDGDLDECPHCDGDGVLDFEDDEDEDEDDTAVWTPGGGG